MAPRRPESQPQNDFLSVESYLSEVNLSEVRILAVPKRVTELFHTLLR
jgi:hypothetical protein